MKLELRTASDAVEAGTDGSADVWLSGFRTGLVVAAAVVAALIVGAWLCIWLWEVTR